MRLSPATLLTEGSGLGEDAEAVRTKPARPADNLIRGDRIGAEDAGLEGDMVGVNLAVTAVDTGGGGFGGGRGLDRGDVELNLGKCAGAESEQEREARHVSSQWVARRGR
jgi:hypothetical protein